MPEEKNVENIPVEEAADTNSAPAANQSDAASTFAVPPYPEQPFSAQQQPSGQQYAGQQYAGQQYAGQQPYSGQQYAGQQYAGQQYSGQPYTGQYAAPAAKKDHLVAGILGILLGALGIHKFYLGYSQEGVIMLLVTLVGGLCTLGLAAIAMEVIGIVEGVLYLCKDQPEFDAIYVYNKKGWF